MKKWFSVSAAAVVMLLMLTSCMTSRYSGTNPY